MVALTYSIVLSAIVVVDGGSNDGAREIVREYARKHPAVWLLEKF